MTKQDLLKRFEEEYVYLEVINVNTTPREIKELISLAFDAGMEHGVKAYKQNVIEYGLKQLEEDLLTGPGMSDEAAQIIDRLRYWFMHNVSDRNLTTNSGKETK